MLGSTNPCSGGLSAAFSKECIAYLGQKEVNRQVTKYIEKNYPAADASNPPPELIQEAVQNASVIPDWAKYAAMGLGGLLLIGVIAKVLKK